MVLRIPPATLFAVLVACTGNPSAPEESAAPGEPPSPGGKTDDPISTELPDNVHWVRNSAEYGAMTRQVYRLGMLKLDAVLAARPELEAGRWAVVLDVDETVLGNSLFRKECALEGECNFASWVFREEAVALPGAAALAAGVHERGGVVATVTNRPQFMCGATTRNLAAEAIPFDVALCKTSGSDKEDRFEDLESGEASLDLEPVEILQFYGDNIHDFPELEQDLRFEGDEAHAEFGDRFFVLPNPMTGSWTQNPRD